MGRGGDEPARKLHTSSGIGSHIFGNYAHVVAATTAVGVGSTVLTVTSTVMTRTIHRGRGRYASPAPLRIAGRWPAMAAPPGRPGRIAAYADGPVTVTLRQPPR